jgi:membrane protease YdiL (CAAX protease family)
VVAAYFLEDTILTTPYHQTRAWLGISSSPPNTLLCAAYSILVSFRLLWWLIIAGSVAFIDPPGITPFLRHHQRQVIYLLKGLAIGFSVMVATVLMIVAVGDAQLRLSPGSASIHAACGIAWLLAEIVGAAGEEVLFRGLILVLASRLLGMRMAIVISALAFSLAHGANPGASYIWMVRLAAAGMLLGYSLFRSGTLWWGIGYHAGWNFASAPLFGAVGSGYLDQGHIFAFLPSGNALVTGGPVGQREAPSPSWPLS